MSGGEPTSERPDWTLVGAGSLGSKLALHLARAGNGPDVILDKSHMTPHNAARHALIPTADAMQIRWVDAKARTLSDFATGPGPENNSDCGGCRNGPEVPQSRCAPPLVETLLGRGKFDCVIGRS